ncbi:MAG TPA: hypothetical protein PLC07_09205 [Bacillota bacterium]|nr:hypothetical protein [Bacillota bacterium]HPT87323.1 hypothetical protein [Bacillota bacterium]
MEEPKQRNEKIKKDNYRIFALLSHYLNHMPDFVNEEIESIVECGVSYEYAFALILATAFGLDVEAKEDDKDLFVDYFIPMIHQLDPAAYYSNPYYQNIKIPTVKIGNSELKYESYKPFEGFVCNDIVKTREGRQIPQIGFFRTEFRFPAILEKGRIWMTITPNEIETMREAVDKARGRVLTFGLGLGYYAYMVSEKENVESVTIVESNRDIIDLFTGYILPQFKNAHKITILQTDAFDYAKNHMAKGGFDVVFTDLWHDVSDGLGMYLQMKTYEKLAPNSLFLYWLEKSILCYV